MKSRYLLLAFLLLSVTSLFVGVKDISPTDVFSLSRDQIHTLWVSRVPRLVSIVLSGVSMSVAGLIMMQLSRNKFVSPTTAGTLDSARLGILTAMLLFPAASPIVKMLCAFIFALAGTFIFMKLLDRVKYKDAIFIPLVGIMFGSIVGSVTTFLAYKHNLIQSISAWLNGDFSVILQGRYEMLYISLPLMVLAYLYANRFTIAGMGEDFALNLGLSYKQVVRLGLIIVALVSASVVLTVGMLPFLSLIIPNIVSLYNGDHLQKNLPHTALLGALFVLFCDILGRVVLYPYEVPIGLTMGLLGSGIFLLLLMRSRSYES